MLFAHIFKRGKLYQLVITSSPSLAGTTLATLQFSSKLAAKRVAATHYNATPHNY
jgi:hypothetical protein